jgi:hypothetical protein
MGYILLIVSCFVFYYAYKIWNEFQTSKSSQGYSSSIERKTRNEMNRYKELQKMRYGK